MPISHSTVLSTNDDYLLILEQIRDEMKKSLKQQRCRNSPAWSNKTVKYNTELQRHILVIHPTNDRPKLQVENNIASEKLTIQTTPSVKQKKIVLIAIPSMQSTGQKGSPFELCSWLYSKVFLQTNLTL